MSVSYSQHFLLALWALITGFGLGFVYEWFRILHSLHPRVSLLIFAEDVIFGILCGSSLAVLFFNLSYGRMRFYGFVFCIAGFLLWYFTVGRLFRKAFAKLCGFLKPPIDRVRAYFVYRVGKRKMMIASRGGFGARRMISSQKSAFKKGKNHVPSS